MNSGFRAKLPTLVASIAPFLVVVAFMRKVILIMGIPLLASGCLGSVIGAIITERMTTTPHHGATTCQRNSRGSQSFNAVLGLCLSPISGLVGVKEVNNYG